MTNGPGLAWTILSQVRKWLGALMVCKQTIAALMGWCLPARLLANAGAGDDRDRTGDPLLAKQVLSQLSYAPKLDLTCHNRITRSPQPVSNTTDPARSHWWAREDLNLRPHAYQACALTS
jgi:hypothetical protein